MASLSLRGIYKTYTGGFTAVKDFNLEIEDKEFIIFVGPSGCGTSTTLRMIAGLEEITEGELYIGDKLMNDVAPKDRDIAMVFQNYALYPHMTVFENMAFRSETQKNSERMKLNDVLIEAAQYSWISRICLTESQRLCQAVRDSVLLSDVLSFVSPQVFLLDEPLVQPGCKTPCSDENRAC